MQINQNTTPGTEIDPSTMTPVPKRRSRWIERVTEAHLGPGSPSWVRHTKRLVISLPRIVRSGSPPIPAGTLTRWNARRSLFYAFFCRSQLSCWTPTAIIGNPIWSQALQPGCSEPQSLRFHVLLGMERCPVYPRFPRSSASTFASSRETSITLFHSLLRRMLEMCTHAEA